MNIGLLWHSFGHPNLGLDALARSHIAILRSAAARAGIVPTFKIFSTPVDGAPPDDPDVTRGPQPRMKDLLVGREFRDAVTSCDIVFDMSEGDSFTDIYGVRRFVRQSLSKRIVLAENVPLVLAPQTIGPFKARWTRTVATALMRRCRAVIARDDISARSLDSLGTKANAHEFTDVAFRLPYTAQPRSADRVRPLVGINVSALMYYGGYTGKNEFGLSVDYRAFTERLIERLLEQGRVDVVLVPHVLSIVPLENEQQIAIDAASASASEDDRVISFMLQAKYPAVAIAPHFRTSSDAKTFIATLDALVAGRMHACIAALSTGVAVLPVAYSPKFAGLFGALGYPWMIDARLVGTDEALSIAMEGIAGLERLKRDAVRCAGLALEKLEQYEDFLATLLPTIPVKPARA